MENIRPGVICWLYFLRWKIEKAFDCFKNALGARKAWAVGSNTIEIQGGSICIIYNFIQFLSETIQEEYQYTDKKVATPYNTALYSKVGGHPMIKIRTPLERSYMLLGQLFN